MKTVRNIMVVASTGLMATGLAYADNIRPNMLSADLSRATNNSAVVFPSPENSFNVMKDVKVTRVTGTIDVKDVKPRVVMKHTIANMGSKEMDIRATMSSLAPKTVKLGKNSENTVNFEAPIEVKKGTKFLRSIKVSPQLVVDEALLINPVSDYAVNLVLPQDAKKIVKSNKALVPVEKTDGRLTYKWAGKNEYMTPLQVWWTTSSTDLSVTKDITPNWNNNTVVVSIKVKNNGSGPAKAVMLKEDFPTQHYAALDSGSEGKFTVYKGAENDRRLIWEYAMPELGSGQETVVKYNLKIEPQLGIVGLHETSALQDGEPIAVSDLVRAERPRK